MLSNSTLKLQQSPLGVALPGCWKLVPERAVTLNPGEAGVLRVAQGQVWATLDGPHHGPANDWGDVILHPGEQLNLVPGQHLVVEPFGAAVNQPVYFSWEPSGAVAAPMAADRSGWRAVIASGMRELVAAAQVHLGAVRRKLSWLAGTLQFFVAGKGRVLSRFESNQP